PNRHPAPECPQTGRPPGARSMLFCYNNFSPPMKINPPTGAPHRMGKKLKTRMARAPFLGRALLAAFRARLALGHFRRPMFYLIKWVFKSRETTNFTYDLEKHNKRYLASLI